MTAEEMNTCEFCRFWYPHYEGSGRHTESGFYDGACRRRSPVVLQGPDGMPYSTFPGARRHWSCGEHQLVEPIPDDDAAPPPPPGP